MSLSFAAEVIPLKVDLDGIVRVGNTRVTLDTVILAFKCGATAEEIVQQYLSLHLADVYQVMAYYLRHSEEVETYIQHRKLQADAVRQENEARFDPQGVRDRLMARRANQRS